jgi:glycosyltransferase involved in cell wall biosynthesis
MADLPADSEPSPADPGSAGPAPTEDALRGLVVLEQTLGHVTHGNNLQRLLPAVPGFDPEFALVPFDVSGWPARIPGYGNWTIRAGWRARRLVRGARRRRRPDVMIVHTQVPAILLGRAVASIPTVVSLDATPKQYDSLGEHYAHDVGPEPVERTKTWLNTRCFERAEELVTWAEWTKSSLVDEYGIESGKITVIPPGVDAERWAAPAASARPGERDDEPVRILFVGGNLRRKGGHHLVEAFGRLRQRYGDGVELHLVTTSPVDGGDATAVYDSMTPNSPELIALYHRCDIFCLPTLGDCLPMVLPEAGAAGLALVATDVGAIGEVVRDGETGLLVPVGDVDALTAALGRLIDDRALRSRVAAAAAALVRSEHDAATNAARIVEVARRAADRRRASARR